MDGRDTVENSLGRAPVGRRDTGSDGRVDGRETGKPWEIAWGESSGGKERCGSDERVDGGETVRNSLGRAPVGRSDTGVTTGWTEGIETVGNSLGRVPVGRERYGSDDEGAIRE